MAAWTMAMLRAAFGGGVRSFLTAFKRTSFQYSTTSRPLAFTDAGLSATWTCGIGTRRSCALVDPGWAMLVVGEVIVARKRKWYMARLQVSSGGRGCENLRST